MSKTLNAGDSKYSVTMNRGNTIYFLSDDMVLFAQAVIKGEPIGSARLASKGTNRFLAAAALIEEEGAPVVFVDGLQMSKRP